MTFVVDALVPADKWHVVLCHRSGAGTWSWGDGFSTYGLCGEDQILFSECHLRGVLEVEPGARGVVRGFNVSDLDFTLERLGFGWCSGSPAACFYTHPVML
jgi:hypothetical protein